MLVWLYYLILAILLIGGVYLTLLTLPGIWLMVFATLIYALITHFHYAGLKTLIAIVVLAGIAELIDTFAAGAGGEKAGASKLGLWGALIGGIVAGFFLSIPVPVIGTIIGICVGTFAGAILGEIAHGAGLGTTVRVGFGAAWGRLMGILIKLLFGCIVLATVLITALPPIPTWASVRAMFHHSKPVPALTTAPAPSHS